MAWFDRMYNSDDTNGDALINALWRIEEQLEELNENIRKAKQKEDDS